MKPLPFIDTDEQLVQLVEFLATADAIAVDTEFVWMRTYFPQLGIIQLATSREDSFIVDCTAITNVEPLKQLLENSSIVKIFHDAHQDITIINRYINGEVHSVFDTQRAAGFTGRIRNLSLEKLIREFTGISLAKSETRTNWLKRPLDPEQIEYALDDVRYLPEVRLQLIEEAEQFGNLAFLNQEMEQFDAIIPFNLQETIEKQFRKTAGRIAPRGRARAWRLVNWQENESRRRDMPREHLIKKESLVDLALSSAVTVEELAATGLLSPKLIERYGKELSETISSEDMPSRELVKSLQRPGSDTQEMNILIGVFHAFCNSVATEHHIDPTLVFNKNDVCELVRSYVKNRELPPIEGWRGVLIRELAEKFLYGKLHLSYTVIPDQTTNTTADKETL